MKLQSSMCAKGSLEWLFFAQRRKHSAHHTAIERQDFIVSMTIRFHGQPIAELVFGVLSDQVDPNGVLTGHRLKLLCGHFRRIPATVHAGDRLFECFQRQVTLTAGGEKVICAIEVLVDEGGLSEFDSASRRRGLVMFYGLSAAVDDQKNDKEAAQGRI